MNRPKTIDWRRSLLPLDISLTLSGTGITRAQARKLIQENRVTTYRKRGDSEQTKSMVSRTTSIQVDQKQLPSRTFPTTYLLYKPRQVLTSHRLSKRDPIHLPLIPEFFQNVPHATSILPVGRLDVESEGLIVLTNDGSLNRILTSPEFGVQKTYRVLAGRDVIKDIGTDATKGVDSSETKKSLHLLFSSLMTCNNKSIITVSKKKRKRAAESNQISCAGFHLHDHNTYARVSPRATKNTQLIVVDITMKTGKNREVRRVLKSIGFRTFMLCRIEIQGIAMSIQMPKTVHGLIRHVQQEAGMIVGSKEGTEGTEGTEGEEGIKEISEIEITKKDVEMVRDHSDGAACGSKDAYDIVRHKAHLSTTAVLQPGGLRRLTNEEIDALFGTYVSKLHER